MKIITFTTLLLSLAITGCQQQQASSTDTNIDAVTTALEKSDITLGGYIEKLESEFTSEDIRTQIICKDYPREYKTNYAPNMLKLSSEYTEALLLSDLDRVLDFYKAKDQIQC